MYPSRRTATTATTSARHAQHYADEFGDKLLEVPEEERRAALVAYALPKNIARMQNDLKKYRIEYDCWFLESGLHKDGEVRAVVDLLTEKGLTYEKEGAIWYRATAFGAEKDEVLVRQNGNPTYFTADIAYHRNKFNRGFSRCIDVWGADHHGHVARMKGAMDAIGLDGSKLDVVLIQLVRLVRDGEVVRMSKRSGKAIQLADLLDEVPIDAARFCSTCARRIRRWTSTSTLPCSRIRRTPSTMCSTPTPASAACCRSSPGEGLTLRPCTDEELALLRTPGGSGADAPPRHVHRRDRGRRPRL